MKVDYSDLTIEDDAVLELVSEHEKAAADWRGDASTLRRMARRYHDLAGAACTPPHESTRYTDLAHNAERKASVKSARERERLVSLNGVMLAHSKAGDTWEVNDSLYRVATEGNPCVRLGSTIPADEPDTDPEWSDRDEQNSRMLEYASMVRVGQP